MKKALSMFLAAALVLSMCACKIEVTPDSTEQSTISNGSVSTQKEDIKEPGNQETDEVKYEITYSNVRVYKNSIGTTWVQSIVEITNTGNSNLYLSTGAYDLEDYSGSLVKAQTLVSTFPNVLAPGEKGYMYDETTLDEDEYDGDGELTILPRPDVRKAKVDLVRYNISELKISDDKFGGVKVSGRIENQTSEKTDGMVYIVAFFYDESGNPIGSAFTILTEEIDSGAKIGLELSGFSLPDDVTSASVSDTVVYAYPLQYQF